MNIYVKIIANWRHFKPYMTKLFFVILFHMDRFLFGLEAPSPSCRLLTSSRTSSVSLHSLVQLSSTCWCAWTDRLPAACCFSGQTEDFRTRSLSKSAAESFRWRPSTREQRTPSCWLLLKVICLTLTLHKIKGPVCRI